MARVLLIKARFNTYNHQACVPPLGVMYLASTLRRAGHEVRIIDTVDKPRETLCLDKVVSDFKPDMLGVSAIAFEFASFQWLMSEIGVHAPGLPVIVGGPLASSNPEATLGTGGVSCIVIGEGENTLLELVPVIMANGDPLSVPGTAVLRNNQVVFANPREMMSQQELDAMPFPAWDLIDVDAYSRIRGMASVGIRRYMQVVTSRGCPFRCIYCHNMMGKRFRPRGAESVLAEINELRQRYDIHEFEIVDDCFNLDRERMTAILDGLIAMNDPKLRLQFPSGLRSDLLSHDDILRFKRAGANFIAFAIETATPRIQKEIHKNLDIEKAVQAISWANRAGIFCNGFFMIGFPGETEAEAINTINLAAATELHEALFFTVTPFRGTPLYQMVSDIISKRFQEMALEDMDFFNPGFNISEMNDKQIKKVFSRAYRKFYMSPKRVMRILARHPRKNQLPMYGVQFLDKSVRPLLERLFAPTPRKK